MNAFETLGIEPRILISDDSIRQAFRDAGMQAHPDAGGSEESFALLRTAVETISSPSRRLRHWLELRGIPVETRGTLDPVIMDLFAHVGEASQRAEAVIRKRDETKSALAHALLERETQHCRELVQRAIMMVETAIQQQCATFADYEQSLSLDQATASTTVRNLAFLEKWRSTLRSVFSRLV